MIIRKGKVGATVVASFILDYDEARMSDKSTKEAKRTQVKFGIRLLSLLQEAYDKGLRDAKKGGAK